MIVAELASLSPDERAALLEWFEQGFGNPYDPADPVDGQAMKQLLRQHREHTPSKRKGDA